MRWIFCNFFLLLFSYAIVLDLGNLGEFNQVVRVLHVFVHSLCDALKNSNLFMIFKLLFRDVLDRNLALTFISIF